MRQVVDPSEVTRIASSIARSIERARCNIAHVNLEDNLEDDDATEITAAMCALTCGNTHSNTTAQQSTPSPQPRPSIVINGREMSKEAAAISAAVRTTRATTRKNDTIAAEKITSDSAKQLTVATAHYMDILATLKLHDKVEVKWRWSTAAETFSDVGEIVRLPCFKGVDHDRWRIKYMAYEVTSLPPTDTSIVVLSVDKHMPPPSAVKLKTKTTVKKQAKPVDPTPSHHVAPSVDHDDPTYWYLPTKYWGAWQNRLAHVLQHYDPLGGASPSNGAIIVNLLQVVKLKLRRPQAQFSRTNNKNLNRQLATDAEVKYQFKAENNAHDTFLHTPSVADQTLKIPSNYPQMQHEQKYPTADVTFKTPSNYPQLHYEQKDPKQHKADKTAVKAATAKLASGEPKSIRKAVRILDSEKSEINPDIDVLSDMKKKHPTRAGPLPAVPPGDHECVDTLPEDLMDTIQHLMGAVAPAESGLTEELLWAGCHNALVAEKIAAIVTHIRNNKVHKHAATALRRCRLFADGKPDGSLRPVAIGEVLLKIAMTLSVYECADYLARYFDGLQYGNAKAGCEHVAHTSQDALDADPEIALMTIDATNAFNSMCRVAMANALYGHQRLSSLFHVFDLAYTIEGELVLKHGGEKNIILSSDGARQGCVLGGILFCLGLHPILEEAHALFPDVTIKAIMDDVNMWGHPDRVLECYDYIDSQLFRVRLVSNEKTTLYPPKGYVVPKRYLPLPLLDEDGLHLHDASNLPMFTKGRITVDEKGCKILGTMRSRDPSHVKNFLEKKIKKGQTLFRRLEMLPPNQAFTLLQKCGIPRATYLIRTHATEVTRDYCDDFDRCVTVVAGHCAQRQLTEVSRETALLLHLPPKKGGLGLTVTTWIREAAFDASHKSCTADKSLRPLPPNQETLVTVLNIALAKEVDDMGVVPRAHRSACCEKFSSLWTTSLVGPFPSAAFSAMLRWRAVCYDSDVAQTTTCSGCMNVFPARDYHEHKPGCARLRSQNATTTHTAFNRAVQNLCVRAGVTFIHEPRYEGYVSPDGPYADEDHHHKEGPDLTVHLCPPLTVDFKGINGSAPSYARSKISTIEGAKTRAAEALYQPFCEAAGEDFQVLCFHVCGRLDKKILSLVSNLVAQRPETLVFKDEIRRLSVAIATAVGRILLRHGGTRPLCAEKAPGGGNADTAGVGAGRQQ